MRIAIPKLFRFRTWTMLGIVAAVAVVLGGWVRRANHERTAYQAIRATNSEFRFTHQHSEGGTARYSFYSTKKYSSVDEFWRDSLGEHFFYRIDAVQLGFYDDEEPAFTNQRLQSLVPHLSRLKLLKNVEVNGLNIKHDGLMVLANLPRTENLRLTKARVDDAHLAFLADLTELRELSVHCTRADGRFLHYLKEMPHLYRLELRGENLTVNGLDGLASLKNLTHLGISGKRIDGSVLRLIAKLPVLGTLRVRLEQLTNDSIAPLADSRVTHLDLAGPITDDVFRNVAKIKTLETLRVDSFSGKINGSGFSHLDGHPNLQQFSMWIPEPTDNCFAAFASIPNLKALHLICPISEENFRHVQALKSLESFEGGMTQEQDRRLRNSLPNCHIYNE